MLNTAIRIAAEAHAGQEDKGGAPYILHPLRVMLSVEGNEARCAAVLHDVLEDCPHWTRKRLAQEGIAESVLSALDALTRREGEEYMAFVRRAGLNPIARAVKLADLADNMNLKRLPSPSPEDVRRAAKYHKAREMLSRLPTPPSNS